MDFPDFPNYADSLPDNPIIRHIYQKANEYYASRGYNARAIEDIVNKCIGSDSVSQADLMKANRLLKIPAESVSVHFMGYLFFALEWPPYWDIRLDPMKSEVYFLYSVIWKGHPG